MTVTVNPEMIGGSASGGAGVTAEVTQPPASKVSIKASAISDNELSYELVADAEGAPSNSSGATEGISKLLLAGKNTALDVDMRLGLNIAPTTQKIGIDISSFNNSSFRGAYATWEYQPNSLFYGNYLDSFGDDGWFSADEILFSTTSQYFERNIYAESTDHLYKLNYKVDWLNKEINESKTYTDAALGISYTDVYAVNTSSVSSTITGRYEDAENIVDLTQSKSFSNLTDQTTASYSEFLDMGFNDYDAGGGFSNTVSKGNLRQEANGYTGATKFMGRQLIGALSDENPSANNINDALRIDDAGISLVTRATCNLQTRLTEFLVEAQATIITQAGFRIEVDGSDNHTGGIYTSNLTSLGLTVPEQAPSTETPSLGSNAPVAGLAITRWIKVNLNGVEGYLPFFST